jgi:hypothetical protein
MQEIESMREGLSLRHLWLIKDLPTDCTSEEQKILRILIFMRWNVLQKKR